MKNSKYVPAPLHAEWAVKFQCLEMEIADIARAAKTPEDDVRRAIKRFLALVELSPRKPLK